MSLSLFGSLSDCMVPGYPGIRNFILTSILNLRKVPVQRSTLLRKLPAARRHGNPNRQPRNLHAHQQRSRLGQLQGVVESSAMNHCNSISFIPVMIWLRYLISTTNVQLLLQMSMPFSKT